MFGVSIANTVQRHTGSVVLAVAINVRACVVISRGLCFIMLDLSLAGSDAVV